VSVQDVELAACTTTDQRQTTHVDNDHTHADQSLSTSPDHVTSNQEVEIWRIGQSV